MFRYRIGGSPQTLILTDEVLRHFARHRQSNPSLPEAGGQLFARFNESEISIEKATGPRSTDRRGRTSYHPDRRAEQHEIDRLYKDGFHYVGDWHTHPCARPQPSQTDIASIAETANKSAHDLNGFLLIIVGTDPFPSGVRVSLHTGSKELLLDPLSCDDGATGQAGLRENIIRLFRKPPRSSHGSP